MQTEHSPFPSDETLAAYIDGRLDEETRKRVVEHMASCAECFDVVMGAGEMARAAEPAPHVLTWRRNVVPTLAAAAALAAAVLLTPIRERIWPRDDLRALAAVAPPERFSDGRISGFPYRPRARVFRGGEHDITNDPENLPFLSAAARVHERAAEHPDARTLHAEGVSQLVLGGDAVTTLEEALRQESHERNVQRAIEFSSDPRLLNDLAAAYIAAGRAKDASVVAERAWNQSRTPEAAWNRAIAAELPNDRTAITKWHEYLKVDGSSRWAADARERLDKLEHPRTSAE